MQKVVEKFFTLVLMASFALELMQFSAPRGASTIGAITDALQTSEGGAG